MKKNLNSTKLFIVIVVIVVLILFPFIFTKLNTLQKQTTIDKSSYANNWKTLNNVNGFSIKYPSSVIVEGVDYFHDATKDPSVFISQNPNIKQTTTMSISIKVYEKINNGNKDLSLQQISKENYEANLANHNTFKQLISPIKITTLDGKPAYTYTMVANAYSGKGSGYEINGKLDTLTVIESENNGNYFTIVYAGDNPMLSTIISSLKF